MNTRRLAERLARHLSERLGDDAVTAHHGSLSKEKRLDAETRLKSGQLKALVATASLELGIDIGHVDLVCQIGSPHRIATLLQRVGRSGHTIAGTPKGRVFPVSRDDLVECAALLRSIRSGLLDAIVPHDAPLDVLAQQIVAETACRDYSEDELFALVTRRLAVPRPRARVVRRVLADDGGGLRHPSRPPRALVHRDEVNATVRGRRGREAAGPDVGRRHPRGRRLPRRPRSRRHVHRHAQRGLRHREHGRRRLPARQRVVAASCRSRAAMSGWPMPRARRRRSRSGSARRRRAATSCRARSATCAPRSTGGSTTRPARRPRIDWLMAETGLDRTPPIRWSRTWPTAAARSASCRRRRRSCSSGSSTSPAACSSCCTRRSAAASTRPGGWPCGSASAGSSTSSCRRRRPRTR